MTAPRLTFDNLANRAAEMGGLFVGLDRDGTLIEDCGYSVTQENVVLKSGLKDLHQSLCRLGFSHRSAIFTNQSAVGRGYTSLEEMASVNRKVIHLANQHVGEAWLTDADVFSCPHRPDQECDCRKPNIKMYLNARTHCAVERWPFLMIGDRCSDTAFAHNAGGIAIELVTLESEGMETKTSKRCEKIVSPAWMRAQNLSEVAAIINSIPNQRRRRDESS